MTDPGDPKDRLLGVILAGLGGEIVRPLESLRGEVGRLLNNVSNSMSEAERVQATTILGLCEDLSRLTRECLSQDVGGPDAES